MKAVGGPDKADRAFMLVNFKPGQETFDLYYQIDGKLISWQELDPELVEKIRLQLLPQAPAVSHAVNENYEAANVPMISYAMLQLETATMAWFGRKLTTATPFKKKLFWIFSPLTISILGALPSIYPRPMGSGSV